MKKILTAFIRWFDSDFLAADLAQGNSNPAKRVDWFRVAPFIFLHAACLAVFWVGFSWVALAACAFFYAIRMFAITGVYHRYFSHRSYKTSRFFQFLLALLGATAVQRGPLWWAAHHRHHHKFSDTPQDVHSPRQHGFWWSHMGWITDRNNFPTKTEYIGDLTRFPELVFLNRFDTLVPILFATGLFLCGGYLQSRFPELGTSSAQLLVWGFFISTTLVFHATQTINSLSHLFGSQRYRSGDDSRNNVWLALLTFGEGWHNNHHHYQASTRQGFFWWEIDLTYYALKMLSWTGLIWDLRPVPQRMLEANTIDAPNRTLSQTAA